MNKDVLFSCTLACPKKHEVLEINGLSEKMIDNLVRNNFFIHEKIRKNRLRCSLGVFLKKVTFYGNLTKSAQKKEKI